MSITLHYLTDVQGTFSSLGHLSLEGLFFIQLVHAAMLLTWTSLFPTLSFSGPANKMK
jgi:hypothetical protein